MDTKYWLVEEVLQTFSLPGAQYFSRRGTGKCGEWRLEYIGCAVACLEIAFRQFSLIIERGFT